MTQPAKVQEPSMEEILASIRRIIADDEAKPAAAEKLASPAAAVKPVMKDIPPSAIAPAPEPAPPTAAFSKVEPQDDIEFTEAKASRRQPVYEPAFESTPARPILSHSTVSAVESAFNSLANTVLSNNARTLEDLVKEMLRPMLKSWLDDNLPGLVERIVKAEIERVSRGRQ